MNFNFGSSTAKTTASTILGSTTSTATPSFNLGTTSTTTSGLTFGTPTATGFSLGAGDNKSTGFASPAQTTPIKPVAATTQFSLGGTPTTGFTGFGLTKTAATTTAPALGSTTTSTPSAINFNLTPSTTTTTTPSLKLGATTTATPSLGQATSTPATTTLDATSNSTAALRNINFARLEEDIKKWTLEIDEQEKIFIGQVNQINKWDALLNSNSDKIVELNDVVERLRMQQLQMDNELDFAVAQQKELGEVLDTLEQQASELSTTSDPEREHLYHLSESLNTQIKQMSKDLKEVVDNVNESNQTQDSSDPIVQIGRILNAQMGSLEWVDQMIINIQNSLQNVTKLHDSKLH